MGTIKINTSLIITAKPIENTTMDGEHRTHSLMQDPNLVMI